MALETEEESHVAGLVELEELEAIEIDEAFLRELLEADDIEESVQKDDNKTMLDIKQQDQKNQQLEGCNNIDQFEWVNSNNNNNNNMMMMMMMMKNWFPDDDMVGMMVDFGCSTNNNAQVGSQVCEGLICYEASYGSLWDDL